MQQLNYATVEYLYNGCNSTTQNCLLNCSSSKTNCIALILLKEDPALLCFGQTRECFAEVAEIEVSSVELFAHKFQWLFCSALNCNALNV